MKCVIEMFLIYIVIKSYKLWAYSSVKLFIIYLERGNSTAFGRHRIDDMSVQTLKWIAAPSTPVSVQLYPVDPDRLRDDVQLHTWHILVT